MKYMSFNRSCTYAGLANLLYDIGIDVEDYEIALGAMLPYHIRFSGKDGTFLAGPMLQEKRWFDVYLNKVGYQYYEKYLPKEEVIDFLIKTDKKCMFGIKHGETGKHAVIFDHYKNGIFTLLNNKHITSSENGYFMFDRSVLSNSLEEITLYGYIETYDGSTPINFEELFLETNRTVLTYRDTIKELLIRKQSPGELENSKHSVFEALYLDIYSMMKITGYNKMTEKIETSRREYLNALSLNRSIRLIDCLNDSLILEILEMFFERSQIMYDTFVACGQI